MKRRRGVDRVAWGVLCLLTGAGVGLLFLILGLVAVKGAPALSLAFFLEESRNFGAQGGIAYQIAGTVLLMTGAVVLSLPVALGTALFQTEYLRSPRLRTLFRQAVYSLNGVPTILFGLVGYLVFGVLLNTGISWLTGTLILAVMIFPTLEVSIQESIESIPEAYRDTGLALGLTPLRMVASIILPQSAFGIITGALLGLARAAGETAAIMFTATTFSGVRLPQSFADPVPTLQTHILALSQDALDPRSINQAWGAGLVLLGMVFVLIFISLCLRYRIRMEAES